MRNATADKPEPPPAPRRHAVLPARGIAADLSRRARRSRAQHVAAAESSRRRLDRRAPGADQALPRLRRDRAGCRRAAAQHASKRQAGPRRRGAGLPGMLGCRSRARGIRAASLGRVAVADPGRHVRAAGAAMNAGFLSPSQRRAVSRAGKPVYPRLPDQPAPETRPAAKRTSDRLRAKHRFPRGERGRPGARPRAALPKSGADRNATRRMPRCIRPTPSPP